MRPPKSFACQEAQTVMQVISVQIPALVISYQLAVSVKCFSVKTIDRLVSVPGQLMQGVFWESQPVKRYYVLANWYRHLAPMIYVPKVCNVINVVHFHV